MPIRHTPRYELSPAHDTIILRDMTRVYAKSGSNVTRCERHRYVRYMMAIVAEDMRRDTRVDDNVARLL